MIYAEKYGNGKQILIGIHGWGGSHQTFLPLKNLVHKDYSMINLDLPGYGKSSVLSEWNLPKLIEHITEKILKVSENKPVKILGNCSGALLAVLVSKSMKINVSHMYLIDPFSYAPWYFKIFTNKFFGEYAYKTTFKNPLGRIITNLSLSSKKQKETNMTSSFKNIDSDVSLNYLKMLVELENTTALENISCPITIIHGDKTFKSVFKSLNYYQKIWENSTIIELKKVGHLPIEEAPKKISKIIFNSNQN
ncbi:MAG: hypothetical protein CL764_06130 [Chloroflexi bacterium]|nr:hypothetical protein [Chloroflexota bacterium]|tara:strand:+ start:1674 stop:2423 length:750 start_codon:yes stop_codon:yes gene_type:complete